MIKEKKMNILQESEMELVNGGIKKVRGKLAFLENVAKCPVRGYMRCTLPFFILAHSRSKWNIEGIKELNKEHKKTINDAVPLNMGLDPDGNLLFSNQGNSVK